MKLLTNTLFISFLLFSACNNEKTAEETTTSTTGNNAAQPEKKETTENVPGTPGAITGDWKLDWEVFDDNGNWKMEPEERAKAYKNNYRLVLRPDGTSRMMNMFNGRYEVKTENGRQMLYVYRERVAGEEDEDPLPEIFHIYSAGPDELILQVVMAGEPSSFWIFKRA